MQTLWFQAVRQNHIVWDAVEVVDFSRKHTANVYEAVADIRSRYTSRPTSFDFVGQLASSEVSWNNPFDPYPTPPAGLLNSR